MHVVFHTFLDRYACTVVYSTRLETSCMSAGKFAQVLWIVERPIHSVGVSTCLRLDILLTKDVGVYSEISRDS